MTGTLLAIDASTYAGTVALVRDGRVVAEGEAAMRGEREERLMPAVIELLAGARTDAADLDAVVCGAGPGSFTSLRIAASIAKGLSFALGIPLWSAPSLALVLCGGRAAPPAGRYLATLDAMRGEAYAQHYVVDGDGGVRALDGIGLVPAGRLVALAESSGATVAGPADGEDRRPHARGVARLASGELLTRVDLARWEPDYGRLAEAQVRWEQSHGRPLGAGG